MQIYIFFCFTGYCFFIKICWKCFCFFVIWLSFCANNFITRFISFIILTKYLPFLQVHVAGYQIQTFSCICFLYLHWHLLLFHFWIELHFLSLHFHLYSYDTCLVNVFDSFIPVIMLHTLKFKSSVLFGTHTL